MKRALVVLLSLCIVAGMMSFRITDPTSGGETKIVWLTLEEAYKRSLKEPRKIYVDLYTEWCGWCKVQDKKTFVNAAVIDLLNKKYYAVKFNPETDKDVKLGATTFNKIMEGNVKGYPTSAFLDEKANLIQAISSYLDPREFHKVSTYFGEDFYKKEAYNQFEQKTYPAKYEPKTAQSTKVQ